MSDRIVHVTDASFEDEVLKSAEPVLVDYWADWCGPCKMIAPVLDEIADEYAGRLKVAKLNIDENPDTPPRYGIRGIPTLMLFTRRRGGGDQGRRRVQVAAHGLYRQQPLSDRRAPSGPHGMHPRGPVAADRGAPRAPDGRPDASLHAASVRSTVPRYAGSPQPSPLRRQPARTRTSL